MNQVAKDALLEKILTKDPATMTMAARRAQNYAASLAHTDRHLFPMTMTDATECIWGTSGRGNPNAVRIIEGLAMYGYVRIEKVGKVKRLVHLTAKALDLPAPACP